MNVEGVCDLNGSRGDAGSSMALCVRMNEA